MRSSARRFERFSRRAPRTERFELARVCFSEIALAMNLETTSRVESHGDTEPRGTRVKSSYVARLLTYLMVMGPGLIVMEADNDAGAVSTYAQAGGQYGLRLLWVLLILLPVTYFVQETVVRLGIATGKGHAAMIYQRFGPWWGLFSLCDLHIVSSATLVASIFRRWRSRPAWSCFPALRSTSSFWACRCSPASCSRRR